MNIEPGKAASASIEFRRDKDRLGKLVPNPKAKLKDQFHEVARSGFSTSSQTGKGGSGAPIAAEAGPDFPQAASETAEGRPGFRVVVPALAEGRPYFQRSFRRSPEVTPDWEGCFRRPPKVVPDLRRCFRRSPEVVPDFGECFCASPEVTRRFRDESQAARFQVFVTIRQKTRNF